jgi:hypothetical protein
MAGRGQAPALDGRQVPAHAVHLADARAAGQQRLVDGLLVGQRQALARQRQQRRAAAEIRHSTRSSAPRPCTMASSRRAAASPAASGTGWAAHDLDALAGRAIAVARDHQALDALQAPAAPVRLHRLRHRGRGLAGADDEHAPAHLRQVGRKRGTHSAGWALATAASNICRNSAGVGWGLAH